MWVNDLMRVCTVEGFIYDSLNIIFVLFSLWTFVICLCHVTIKYILSFLYHSIILCYSVVNMAYNHTDDRNRIRFRLGHITSN